MKLKSVFVLSALALASHVALASEISLSDSHANLNNGYPSANDQHLLANIDIGADTLSLQADRLRDWGQSATYGAVGYTHVFSQDWSLQGTIGGSRNNDIAPRDHETLMLNYAGLLPGHNLITSIGYDHVGMRSGNKADTLILQSVYYVPGIPLAVQANLFEQSAKGVDTRSGLRYGLAATYGTVGNWTLGVSYQGGKVNYSLDNLPLSVADYNSTSVRVDGRYWINDQFGIKADVSRVRNDYYTRNAVGLGVFYDF